MRRRAITNTARSWSSEVETILALRMQFAFKRHSRLVHLDVR